jgi:hypothetical protein
VSAKLKAAVLVVAAAGAGLAVRALKRALRPDAAPEKLGGGEGRNVGMQEPRQLPTATHELHRKPSRFESATRDQLYQEAKRRGIPNRSKMTKAELQAALEEETGSWPRKESSESE